MKNMKSYSKEILKNISLVIFSILLAIYMLEIAYSLYNISSYKHKKWAKYKRSSFDIYKEYKNSGKDVVVSIYPFTFVSTINDEDEIYPLSGISNKLTIFCNESGYWSTYQSDRYGFNNPNEQWDKLHFDFVLVGDSFTLGACVHEKDTIAGQLRNKAEVLNLGYGAMVHYSSMQH